MLQTDLTASERTSSAIEVLKCPIREPTVELLGEMPESGFKEKLYLVQRNRQFIQLTELLYRIIEQANGEHTLEEIAAKVTGATDWLVSASNVQQLIEAQLIPLDLIVSEVDGLATRGEAAGRRLKARSPLAVNMRVRMLGPRLIDPIAKVLQVFYTPPILLIIIMVAAMAHSWLYGVHGVTDSAIEVLYAPALLLAVLAILLVSGIFHEFGHAAALRYGGGDVRGMGVGLYIVYPALYTDTTDSYRLGRTARVRTDLGGFYFHLIFALGIIALYLATKQEFLLLVVLLIDLEILYQCLPFVRFDGYWALADLTGIPDFFSQMGAFLRSSLPIQGWKGNRLPDLKPWVKAVFIAYITIVVPVLSLLLLRLLINLPDIAVAAQASFLNQVGMLSDAVSSGNLVDTTVAALQTLMLALQMLGIVYILYTVIWKMVTTIRA